MNHMLRTGSHAVALVLALAAVAVRAEPASAAAADVAAVGPALMGRFGIPEARLDDATRRARDLAAGEIRLSAEHRAKFSTFDGFRRMDPHGNHPPAPKH